jgi:hypothetical protein
LQNQEQATESILKSRNELQLRYEKLREEHSQSILRATTAETILKGQKSSPVSRSKKKAAAPPPST